MAHGEESISTIQLISILVLGSLPSIVSCRKRDRIRDTYPLIGEPVTGSAATSVKSAGRTLSTSAGSVVLTMV
jgi:hypothetical protein